MESPTRLNSFLGTLVSVAYMPTLPDYPGVSRIRQQSPGLQYGSPNLPDKIELWAFLCFNLEFIPFSPKIRIFYDSKFGFWGIFARISSLTKSWKLIVMVCNSCKTSYNVLSRLGTGTNCAYGGGGGWSLIFGGLMQKKESPDFRSPEVGIIWFGWPSRNSQRTFWLGCMNYALWEELSITP